MAQTLLNNAWCICLDIHTKDYDEIPCHLSLLVFVWSILWSSLQVCIDCVYNKHCHMSMILFPQYIILVKKIQYFSSLTLSIKSLLIPVAIRRISGFESVHLSDCTLNIILAAHYKCAFWSHQEFTLISVMQEALNVCIE